MDRKIVVKSQTIFKTGFILWKVTCRYIKKSGNSISNVLRMWVGYLKNKYK